MLYRTIGFAFKFKWKYVNLILSDWLLKSGPSPWARQHRQTNTPCHFYEVYFSTQMKASCETQLTTQSSNVALIPQNHWWLCALWLLLKCLHFVHKPVSWLEPKLVVQTIEKEVLLIINSKPSSKQATTENSKGTVHSYNVIWQLLKQNGKECS